MARPKASGVDRTELPIAAPSPWRGRRVALLCAGALLWAVVGLEQFRRAPAYFDDAFISFNYARALTEGRGFVFNAEDGPLEGFTNLSWVLLVAGLLELGAQPEVGSRVVGLGCYALLFAVHAWLLLRARARGWVDLAGVLLIGTLALPYGLAIIAGSGLETSLASLLAVLLVVSLAWDVSPRWVVLVTVVQAAILATRLDGALFLAGFGIALLLREWAQRRSLRRSARVVTLVELPSLAFFVTLLGWKSWYFGSILPNTFFAKSAGIASWDLGWSYWLAFLKNSPQVIPLSALTLVACWPGFGAWVARACAFSLGLYLVYCGKVGGDFMYYRFAFEAYPLWTLGSLLGLVRLGELVPRAWALAPAAIVPTAASLALSMRPPVMEPTFGMQSLELMNAFVVEGKEIGERLREILPPETRIATTLAGTIPYYSRLFVVDQWGLNDRNVARLPDAPFHFRGHVKRASDDYLRSRRVHLVIDHPVVCDCDALCDDGFPHVYVKLRGGRCLRTRYLTRDERLNKYLCESRDFVTRHVACSGDPPPSWPRSNSPRPAEELSEEAFRMLNVRAITRYSFDGDPGGAQRFGIAFGAAPVTGTLPRQQQVTGFAGAYWNSYHGGDEPGGALVLPLPTGTRRVAARIGGGLDCARTFVGVVENGALVSWACGTNEERLRPVIFEVSSDDATLVAVDDADGPWGHILLDEVLALSGIEQPPTR